ncbi:MAG: hypothetical protein GY847_40070 [Proteobacteria bacterium]|nr:hypothetical protein [Pseudomonadota bacterium]
MTRAQHNLAVILASGLVFLMGQESVGWLRDTRTSPPKDDDASIREADHQYCSAKSIILREARFEDGKSKSEQCPPPLPKIPYEIIQSEKEIEDYSSKNKKTRTASLTGSHIFLGLSRSRFSDSAQAKREKFFLAHLLYISPKRGPPVILS